MKKYVLMIMVVLILPNVFAEEIVYNPKCEFPRIDHPNISLDIYGSDGYYPYLVEGRGGIAQINLIVQNNFSNFENEIWVNFIVRCFDDRRNKIADILFDGLRFDLNTTYRNKENKTFTKLVAEEKFYIPTGSNYCAIMILRGNKGGFYGYDKITHAENCEIPELPGTEIGKNIPVITESEYLTERMLEISREQTNISKQQAENSQRQTEIMNIQVDISKQNLKLIENSQFFGIDKGTIIGAIIAFVGSFLGGWYITKKEIERQRMKRVAENICQPLSTTIHYNADILKKPSGCPSNNHWNNIKDIYEFKFTPNKLQDKLKDYFDNKIAKQMERWRNIDDDIGRLLWRIFNKSAKEKGLPTEMEINGQIKKLGYPDFSLSGFCGHAMEYSYTICKWLLDRKKTDLNLIFQTFPKLKQFYDKKDGPFAHQQEKETTDTYNVIIDSILKLSDNLTDEIKEELEEYRQNNNKICKESENLYKELDKIINKYGH